MSSPITRAALRQHMARKHFRAYLEAQPEGAEVGLSSYSTHCPLARYAALLGQSAKVDGDTIMVSVTTYLLSTPNDETSISSPRWVVEFIARLDATAWHPVTREAALAALKAA